MKKIGLFVLLTIIGLNLSAQRSEFGLFGGGSYYIGDLNPTKHFLLTKPAGGVIYRYNLNPRFAFKGDVMLGSVEGSDAVSKANVERNLSFKSPITEFSLQMEFNFFPYISGNKKYPFTPYVFLGVSLFRFNPYTTLDHDINADGVVAYKGDKYYLQQLGTEGQGTTDYNKKPYSLTDFAIPFGLGFKWNVYKSIAIGFEYGLRRTFTDYLDDVSTTYAKPEVLAAENTVISRILADRSLNANGTPNLGSSTDPNNPYPDNVGKQRGNSMTKDWYSFVGITISFRLKLARESCPAYGPKRGNNNYREYQKRY